jgi:hypothetical protein
MTPHLAVALLALCALIGLVVYAGRNWEEEP